MRKKKKKNIKLINVEAASKKLGSLLNDPNLIHWVAAGGAKGIRERLLKVDYNVIRNVVDKVPLINSIIITRCDQILPFCRYITEDQARDGEVGFYFYSSNRRDYSSYDEKVADALGDFIEQTGFKYDSNREDDFADYAQMFVREVLTIDQIATELQPNRLGELVAFWLVDAATIKRVNENYSKKNVTFVQEIDGKVTSEYGTDTLLFDYKNKRVDIRFRGYGYSIAEMCIDLITTLIFGYTHLRDQFVKDKMPKGFLSVMGDIDDTGIKAIQNYWYSAMSGAGGQWTLPILPSGKDGVGIDFKSLGQSNKDMEYHKGMMFVSSIIAALYSIDMAELGIKADDSTSLIGESAEPRLQHSKDRGLQSMLLFLRQHMCKIIRKITKDYKLNFSGLEIEDDLRKAQIRKSRLEVDSTIDEFREKDGKKPFNEEWSKVPLNQYTTQFIMNQKQQEQQQQMGGGEEGEGDSGSDLQVDEAVLEDGDEGDNSKEDESSSKDEKDQPKDWKDLFKSLTDKKELED